MVNSNRHGILKDKGESIKVQKSLGIPKSTIDVIKCFNTKGLYKSSRLQRKLKNTKRTQAAILILSDWTICVNCDPTSEIIKPDFPKRYRMRELELYLGRVIWMVD
ncbi:hypothetical protein PHYBLDRAFT_162634 [Phycomyces blakesleeanus NRRL 1555(-)]|uniref:Homeodomain-like DNA binding domain-containing transcription factor n=1 Tax=Phycomyces blakesleeanus (strain ATCC 8743b / DSM 1359 / FGSC 10004 / NBRC 33097 / NRRL 1555) TaxID=763407 RepID=A0A167QEB4_PHYB8|nr:hypothetical protein PHYBLDRAFT_162634 [Phycomyces blakesleeanus NRRL 1555(-)]OAD79577.1 hypothetical protein PHYBLDRAFT_162634 [Phycomyces blakesleeanus NRRL 1555(-)]|eukprot:XP_018297617.1 hypothetical protein PHYBLDRAFT_162634 [Phycomyces blakesleeanus NRRL 1555(-)]